MSWGVILTIVAVITLLFAYVKGRAAGIAAERTKNQQLIVEHIKNANESANLIRALSDADRKRLRTKWTRQ